MMRLALVLSLLGAFVAVSPAHAAGNPASVLFTQHRPTAARPPALTAITSRLGRQMTDQAGSAGHALQVQNGLVNSTQQLRIDPSNMTGDNQFTVTNDGPITIAEADTDTLQGIFLHPTVSYANMGAAGLYYEESHLPLSDADFYLSYLGSYYTTQDNASAAFNDATTGWSVSPTTCTVPNAPAHVTVQCLDVQFDYQSPTDGTIWRIRFRIVQISNALFEFGVVSNNPDEFNANQSAVEASITGITQAVTGLFATTTPPPGPSPTPTPRPSPTPTPPTQTPVQYHVIARWQNAHASSSLTAKALKKSKVKKAVQADAYIVVDSAPAGDQVQIQDTISRGSKAIATMSKSGALDTTDPTGWYPVTATYKPKKTGTYSLYVRVNIGGDIETSTAKLKVTK